MNLRKVSEMGGQEIRELQTGDLGMNAFLTIKDAQQLLKVPRSWLYERTRKGEIPHVKLGKYIRFDREQLLAWVAARAVRL